MTAPLEPWLDKRGFAHHLGCSVRWIELRIAEGMPHAILAGRVKLRASEAEAWLEASGHLERRGDGTLPTPSEDRRVAA